MSEEEEENFEDEYNKKLVEEIPELITKLEYGTSTGNLNRVKELLRRFVLIDSFEQEISLSQMKHKTGIPIGVLRKGLKEQKKNPDNPYLREEDPFWLKIYEKLEDIYKDKIVSMSDSKQLMVKRGNIYTPDIEEFTKDLSEMCNEFKTGYRNLRNDVLEKFKDSHLFDRDNFCHDPFIINFKNGYYDIKKDKFIPSKKSNKMFFYEIPHDYLGGNYTCPKFSDALHKWLGTKNKVTPRDMFQFIGYTMSLNVGQRKAFLVYGETKSGKTQFQEILKYLVGKENTSEISLQMLGDDKFSASSLEWKILNVFDDLPQKGLNDVSLFKIIAGGGSTFPVRRMHLEPYQGFNTVKLWYNTNIVPMAKSTEDDSFFNRWEIVNFPNEFIEDNPDPVYEDIPEFYRTIIDDKDEVQGIIHTCIEALKILYKNRHFRKELSANSRKIWEYESDPLYAFIDKYTIQDDDDYELCSYFRKWYNTFRKARHPSRPKPGVTAQTLNKEMTIRGYERRQESSGSKSRVYKGLKFNKRFKKDKKNNFKRKSYKTTSEYLKEHPNAYMNGNGEPEQHEDMGQIHWADKDWDDKEKFEGKLIIKKEEKIKDNVKKT